MLRLILTAVPFLLLVPAAPLAWGQTAEPATMPGTAFAPPPTPTEVGPAAMPVTTNLSPPTATRYAIEQPPGQSPATRQPKPQSLEECEVIAKIDGQVVQACDVIWQVNQIALSKGVSPDEILPDQRDMLMQQLVAGLVDTKLLYADFVRTVGPTGNLDTVLANLEKAFEERQIPRLIEKFEATDVDDLERKLVALGSSRRDMLRAFREQAIAQEWLRSKIEFNEEVTHDEMLEYYREHLKDYEYPTQARWEELMVRHDRFATRDEALKAICDMGNAAYRNAIARELSGPIFGEIAKAYSQGYTASDGGIQEWTTQGALKDTAIDAQLFTLPLGQMSKLIETSKGFHIVRVLERKQAGRLPFKDVQKDIMAAIKSERYNTAVKNYITEMRRKARIWTVYTGDTSFEMLARPPAAPGAPARR